MLCVALLLSLTTLAQQQNGGRPTTKLVVPGHLPARVPLNVPLNDEKIEAAISAPAERAARADQNAASSSKPQLPIGNAELQALLDKQLETSQRAPGAGWVMIEGAAYLVIGDTVVPLVGGGASGCLDKDAEATAARLARARAAYAQRLKKD